MVIPILKMKLPQCNAIGVPTPPNNQPQNSLHQITLNIIQKNHVSHLSIHEFTHFNFNHKTVSAYLSKSHAVVFLFIYLVLDSNPMGYFLFILKAKKASIFNRYIYIKTFPFAV